MRKKEEMMAALEKSYTVLAPFSDSARWEFMNHFAHLRYVVEILEKLSTGATVLDVGCYIGVFPLALRMLGYDASGNDKYIFFSKENGNAYGFSNQELEILRNVWNEHGLVINAADILEDSQSTPRVYDIVVSIATIEHQPYPKLFLENTGKFAKSGGYIYVATPNIAKLSNRIRLLLGRAPMANIEEFYMNAKYFNGHWREYTPQELALMAQLSKLKVVWYKAQQVESADFHFYSPKKWLRSLARAIAKYIPGTGDTSLILLQREN